MNISVHVVTYNSEKDIVKCINSIKKQKYVVSNIVVVDNSSEDSTVKLISEKFSDVILICNQINIGFAAAHNQAINITNSDFILVLNPDVELDPGYILNLINVMEANIKIGSASGKLLSPEDKIIDSTGLVMKNSRRVIDRNNGEVDRGQQDIRNNVFGVCGAAAIYRREMIKDISINGEFFDEDFFAYKEDVDVAWRGKLLGWQAIYVPEATAYHERGWKKGNRKQIPLKIRKHSYINRYYMLVKNETFGSFIQRFFPILFFELSGLIYYLLFDRQVFLAWRDFKNNFNKMKQKREQIHKMIMLKQTNS